MRKTDDLAETRRRWASFLADEPERLRIEYVQHAETVVAIAADGALLVRARGGPIYHMGRLSSFKTKLVPAWRAVIPVARHRAILAGLREAEFPVGRTEQMLVPDELPSHVTVEHRSGPRASMSAFHHSVEEDLALGRVVAELRGLAHVVKAGPPTHRLRNPELDEWRSITDRAAGFEGLEPEPTAEARAMAQAAVDRFYAETLELQLRRVTEMHAFVAARREQLRALDPPRREAPRTPQPEAPRVAPTPQRTSPPVVPTPETRTFLCEATLEPAGTLSLHPSGARTGELRLSGFAPTGDAIRRITPGEWEHVATAMRYGNLRELFAFDPELIPFYCASCHGCYAAPEWKLHERSASSVDGVCPQGHRRVMRSD